MRVLMTDMPILRERKLSGVGYYTRELSRALRAVAGADLIYSFPSRWVKAREKWYGWRNQWIQWLSESYETHAGRTGHVAWFKMKSFATVFNFFQSVFPIPPNPVVLAAQRSGCTLYHEPNFIASEFDLPTVISVHDLSAIRFPEWHPPFRVKCFEKLFLARLQRASHLIAISEFGKQEIVKHLGWPADRVTVTYMGVRPGLQRVAADEVTRVLRSLNLPPNYLLHVGTLEPRKNLLMLLKAYCSLPVAVREKHPLVLCGGPGWNSDEIHSFVQSEGKQHNVRWLGYVKNEHFPALYSGARALVFPTFYEGFGMPTIEMMACGGAVLASTAGAVAETVGKQAYLIDPRDDTGWRDAMLRVCTDDDWWNALKDGAEDTAKPYTWERCAQDTLTAYHATLAGAEPAKKAA